MSKDRMEITTRYGNRAVISIGGMESLIRVIWVSCDMDRLKLFVKMRLCAPIMLMMN